MMIMVFFYSSFTRLIIFPQLCVCAVLFDFHISGIKCSRMPHSFRHTLSNSIYTMDVAVLVNWNLRRLAMRRHAIWMQLSETERKNDCDNEILCQLSAEAITQGNANTHKHSHMCKHPQKKSDEQIFGCHEAEEKSGSWAPRVNFWFHCLRAIYFIHELILIASFDFCRSFIHSACCVRSLQIFYRMWKFQIETPNKSHTLTI